MSKLSKLDYYLTLNYPITLYPDTEDGGYVAEIKELPGCLTQGETLEEAISNINEARQLWIETVYEGGREIAMPSTEINCGGRCPPYIRGMWAMPMYRHIE